MTTSVKSGSFLTDTAVFCSRISLPHKTAFAVNYDSENISPPEIFASQAPAEHRGGSCPEVCCS